MVQLPFHPKFWSDDLWTFLKWYDIHFANMKNGQFFTSTAYVTESRNKKTGVILRPGRPASSVYELFAPFEKQDMNVMITMDNIHTTHKGVTLSGSHYFQQYFHQMALELNESEIKTGVPMTLIVRPLIEIAHQMSVDMAEMIRNSKIERLKI